MFGTCAIGNYEISELARFDFFLNEFISVYLSRNGTWPIFGYS